MAHDVSSNHNDASQPSSVGTVDPAVRDEWVAALRSGEFKQATGRLRRSDTGYCCLGVLCEIYRRKTGNGKWVQEHDEWKFVTGPGKSDSDVALLPEPVARWASSPYVSINVPGSLLPLPPGRRTQLLGKKFRYVDPEEAEVATMSVSGLNDDGATFEEIALLLEALPSQPEAPADRKK